MDQQLPGRGAVAESAIDQLFRDARTHLSWAPTPITDADIRAIYDLAKLGPTSANSQPMRVVFVRSPEAKEKLKPALSAINVEKTMSAPVTAIIGYDLDFPDYLLEAFPHRDVRPLFAGKTQLIEETAFRSGTLQGAYLIMAARALGFDCGPMSGFDPAQIDRLFFAGTNIKSNFLCNIGHGRGAAVAGRNPRLDFERTCQIL